MKESRFFADGPGTRRTWLARAQRSAQALSAAARSSRKHFAPSQRAVQVAQKLVAGPKFAPKNLAPKLPKLSQASMQKGPVDPQDPPWSDASGSSSCDTLKLKNLSDDDLVSTHASTAEGDATSICSTSEVEDSEDPLPLYLPLVVPELPTRPLTLEDVAPVVEFCKELDVLQTQSPEVALALRQPELIDLDGEFCGLSPAKFTMALSVAGVLLMGVFEVAENTAKDKVRVYSDVFALLYTCPVFVPVGLLMLSDLAPEDEDEPHRAKYQPQYGRLAAALLPLAYAASHTPSGGCCVSWASNVIGTVLTVLAPPGTCASLAALGQMAFAKVQVRTSHGL